MTMVNLVGCKVFSTRNELSHCLQGIPDPLKNNDLFDPGSDPTIIEKKSFPPFVDGVKRESTNNDRRKQPFVQRF